MAPPNIRNLPGQMYQALRRRAASIANTVKQAVGRGLTRTHERTTAIMAAIWRDEYPSADHPNEHSFVEKAVVLALLSLRLVSLSNFLRVAQPDRMLKNAVDVYVISWAVVLTILLFLEPPAWWGWIAVYRIVDIVQALLCAFLVDSQKTDWPLWSFRRTFCLLLINLYEVVIAYAILHLSFGCVINNTADDCIENSFDMVYYSAVTLVTLGYGDMVPQDVVSKMIAIAQIATLVVIIFAVLPMIVSSLLGKRNESNPL